jgi:hypothetical protein
MTDDTKHEAKAMLVEPDARTQHATMNNERPV